MYSQVNLTEEMERVIPALQPSLHTPECEERIYRQVNVLSLYVAKHAGDNELSAVRRALYLADDLYRKGNGAVKGAIKAVFVYSLSNTLMRVGDNRKRLMSLIPITLFTIYMNQVMDKGC